LKKVELPVYATWYGLIFRVANLICGISEPAIGHDKDTVSTVGNPGVVGHNHNGSIVLLLDLKQGIHDQVPVLGVQGAGGLVTEE
jgi:hypothetical protein